MGAAGVSSAAEAAESVVFTDGCTTTRVYYTKFSLVDRVTLDRVDIFNACYFTITNARVHIFGPPGTIDTWDTKYPNFPARAKREYLYQYGFAKGTLICGDIWRGTELLGRDCHPLS